MRHIFRGVILVAAVGILATGCTTDDTPTATPQVEETEEPSFAYQGPRGPERWGDLDESWEVCGSGTRQSPIDVGAAVAESSVEPLAVDYPTGDLIAIDTGTTVDLIAPLGSTLSLDGVDYELDQIHFHTPSEHHVNDVESLAEFHFVHRGSDDSAVVVSVLVDQGDTSVVWQPLVDAISTALAEGAEPPVTAPNVDLAALLPDTAPSTRYVGSFTTPPCTEGVQWILLDDHIAMSADQLQVLRDRHPGDNDRPIQGTYSPTLIPTPEPDIGG